MGTISKHKIHRAGWRESSQLRYAVAYILITAAALFFLNIYAANTARSLLFNANQAAMTDKVRLISASFSGLDSLNKENAQQVASILGTQDDTRIVVTDAAGVAVYDSLQNGNETGARFLLSAVVQALEGNDVFYCRYQSSVVESYAAAPIMYYDVPIGAVYLMSYNASQGALLRALASNVLRISIVLEVVVILFSFVFAAAFSRKLRRILESIRLVREGDYTSKIRISSRDEMRQLAEDFNALTERLQESEQRRRQFVSDASHELKTPLASIKLMSDSILQNDMDMQTVREFVGDIGTEADRLTRMSEKLLELTRVDSDTEEDREVADIQEVAHRVLRMLQPQMAARSIQLEDRTIPGCTILILEDDLYQILFNLVENGIKYNNDGGLLRLTLEKDTENVTLRVEDSGIGIPADAVEHVFERFYRVDKARSRQAGGSGLGLSIVWDMVVRNYGSVSVHGRPEGGTCFTLTFPLFEIEEEME